MSRAYYNEIDPYAAQWLRNLIAAGLIAPGDVDERSIADVRPDDLAGYEQCHFFAGIGGWSYALRLAGWPDDRPVWTGSCPCQPFSAAGAGKAADDERHLWPRWFPLIAERRPAIVFGEQVEAAIGWGWLDAVFADLEGEGYACGATVLPACGVGAPHIRNRCWFVADAAGNGRNQREHAGDTPSKASAQSKPRGATVSAGSISVRANGRLADTLPTGWPEGWASAGDGSPAGRGIAGGVANAEHAIGRPQRRSIQDDGDWQNTGWSKAHGEPGACSPVRWSDAQWLDCTDGKARPVEPGTFPLVTRLSEGMGSNGSGSLSPFRTIFDPSTGKPIGQAPWRIGMLRAYGNAIVPQVAAEFVSAYMETAARLPQPGSSSPVTVEERR